MLDDIKAFDASLVQDEELMPHEVLQRLVAGESKLKVWREYRGRPDSNRLIQTSRRFPTIDCPA